MTPERLQQVYEIYQAASDRSPAERQPFLAASCGDDSELRQEIEVLLAVSDNASQPDILDRPAMEVAAELADDATETQFMPGSQLGPYRIESRVGAGGMGTVYQATDTRLGRKVAIKVSAKRFSERFEREARAISALNHPNICTLYDIVISKNAPNYLVMELVEGETLAARLKKGKLSADETLKYGGQIADALVATHAKGIIHRDLKPANVMLTKNSIKVLDFGLAKTVLAEGMTGTNVVMGTPAYMAPEQLEGKEADARSDIYALGLVLWEMATGKRPAPGELALMHGLVPQLRPVVERCLAIDPDERWQSAKDVHAVLDLSGRSLIKEVGTAPRTRSRLSKLAWMAAALGVVLAAGVGWWGYSRVIRTAELKPLVRLDLDLGSVASSGGAGSSANVIVSPDGNRLVYPSQGKLFTRRLDQPQATELPGTAAAFAPFFSPDGQQVAFFTLGKLSKVAVEGGVPVELCKAPMGRGGSWGDDGTIVAALGYRGGLSRVSAAGGEPVPLTELQRGEATHLRPQILPAGKAVLFSAAGDAGEKIEVVSLVDHKRKTIQQGGNSGKYVAMPRGPGYLVYVRNGTLLAAPFDLDELAVGGTPVPVLEGVASQNVLSGAAQFDLAQTGTLIYQVGRAAGNALFSLQWLDGADKTESLLAKPGEYRRVRLSPDGQRVTFQMTQKAGTEVWVYDLRRKTITQLTFDGNGVAVRNPVWSPDGRYIVFSGHGGMYWARADGASEPQALTQSKNMQTPYSFAPDGKRLSFDELESAESRLWTMEMTNTGDGLRGGKPEPFVPALTNAHWPVFSPDGHWLAYYSDESGASQLYVRAFPDKGGKWQISANGGLAPMWSPNGRELFFRSADGSLMMATYTAKGDSFVAGEPRVWSSVAAQTFDITPDGKRVVSNVPVDTPDMQRAQSHVVFLLNFYDELRRKVPTGK